MSQSDTDIAVDAVWAAIHAVETAARAVDVGVADRDLAASADQALRAARFDLSECLRRLGRGEDRGTQSWGDPVTAPASAPFATQT